MSEFGMDFYKNITAGRMIKLTELDENTNSDIQVIFQRDGKLALIQTETQIV